MRLFFLFVLTIHIATSALGQDKPPKEPKPARTQKAVTPVSIIRGPYLQVATSTGMTVRWRTDASSRGRVRYGVRKEELSSSVNDSMLTREHIVKITGLEPDTKYFYSIETFNDTLQSGADNYFCTLPEKGKAGFYRIGVFGDCGINSVNQRNVKNGFVQYLGNNYMNAWILLGDNAYTNGTDAEFQAKFFNSYKDDLLKKYPLFPCPGNHDYNDKEFPGATERAQKTHEVAYYQNFSMPVNGESGGEASHNPAFYSFDIGNIHFISLDSYGKEENQYSIYDTMGPQVQWVKKDLENNTNKEWIVAYWHHPPYTMGSHSSDKSADLVKIRQNFIRILERYGVDLVLCGHSHDYERTSLLNGYYGMEADFSPEKYNVSNSSGMYNGSSNSCPYIKDPATDKGTVYVVSGSAGQLGGKQDHYPHKVMKYANADDGGATMLEVNGNRLDVKWVCADGVKRDYFTMMKGVNVTQTITVKKGQPVLLTASYKGDYTWNNSKEATQSITVKPSATSTYKVQDKAGCIKDTFKVTVSR